MKLGEYKNDPLYKKVIQWAESVIIDGQPVCLATFYEKYGIAEFFEMAGLQHIKVTDIGYDPVRLAINEGVTTEEFIRFNYLQIFEDFEIDDIKVK